MSDPAVPERALAEAARFVETRSTPVDRRLRQRILTLHATFHHLGYLPQPTVQAALDALLLEYLEGRLHSAPAREFVDLFFSMRAEDAWFTLHKSGRKALGDDLHAEVKRLILEVLDLDAWSGFVPERTVPDDPSPANPVARTFDEAAFESLMGRFFGRSRLHEESKPAIERLLADSRDALVCALREHGVQPPESERFLERFEESYGTPLREMLENLGSDDRRAGRFWLGR